jgi:hypothetical protein
LLKINIYLIHYAVSDSEAKIISSKEKKEKKRKESKKRKDKGKVLHPKTQCTSTTFS